MQCPSSRFAALALLAALVACAEGRTTDRPDDVPGTTGAAVAGEPSPPAPAEPPRRGLYVTDTAAAARDRAKAARLVDLVRRDRFDRVVLYGIAPLLGRADGRAQLVQLLADLRAAGIRAVALPVAGPRRVHELREAFQATPGLHVEELVTEDEWWNRCREPAIADPSRVRTECFEPFESLLRDMRALAAENGRMRVGAYLGYPTRAEIERLAGVVDFVHLDYPVRNVRNAWAHAHGRGGALRARFLACADAGIAVWPILYARGEVQAGAWIREHGVEAAEAAFLAGAREDEAFQRVEGRLAGFQYFADDAL